MHFVDMDQLLEVLASIFSGLEKSIEALIMTGLPSQSIMQSFIQFW